MLLRDIKNIFHNELDALFPKTEVDSFFYNMLEHYLGLERFVLVLNPELTLSKEEETPLFDGLSRLKQEEPLQYILGETYFLDFKLKVDPSVLIPRPETEELVSWVIDDFRSQQTDINILDIGTGSGCIAIALAKELPNAKVQALDVSEAALKIARENAELNNVEIEFFHADILDLNTDLNFDVIISNPPYVRELEKKEMKNNVKSYEPQQALFVPNENPLKFYNAIVDFALEHLNRRGCLYLEINQYLSKETKQLLVDNDFTSTELKQDIFGNFRMLKGIRP
ncbi:peptide chain release factor N(5)-glutamine methyltransferase [Croceivirga thetidis]|uniref:peptide chain release factor N(5)-glutamine methyltransferase n=1 Tax=Croceivirga thetidis TaxID=2721623 RepID=UPI001FF0C025|nr:peptide chain release factor N(5)-glutamine methyltransferase [Croceivirga thetidis]